MPPKDVISSHAAVIDVIDFQPERAHGVGKEHETDVQLFVESSTSLAVTDLASLEGAVAIRQAIGGRQKKIVEFFRPLKDAAFKMHRAICQRESDVLGPLDALDRQLRSNISDFKTAQDRLRAARERELAEQQRIEQQIRAAVEAAALESAGETEMAAAVIEEAIAAPMPIAVLPDETKQVVGLKFRTEWKWRFATDEARALQLIPREFLSIDPRKLTAFAKAMKGAGKVPGVVFYSDQMPVR